ncbi:TlpA disulfide reductase family protein [Anaerobacillus sp. MEB173]|uniref:TlpA disulfide reductase family protein n=1 Tax=Anaerobacillus sp. MEB173 TaxID=3383345 RepID=UPI003F91CDBF
MNRRNAFFSLTIFFLMFIVGVLYERSDTVLKNLEMAVAASTNEGAQVGNVAVDFTLLNTKGETVSLTDYKGKTVLLNFFATWCGPCLEEMPALVELDKRLSDEELIILGVNLTKQERNANDVRPFLDHFHAEFDVVFDVEGKVMENYQLIGIPTSVIINEKGKIIARINGMLTAEQVMEIVQNNM